MPRMPGGARGATHLLGTPLGDFSLFPPAAAWSRGSQKSSGCQRWSRCTRWQRRPPSSRSHLRGAESRAPCRGSLQWAWTWNHALGRAQIPTPAGVQGLVGAGAPAVAPAAARVGALAPAQARALVRGYPPTPAVPGLPPARAPWLPCSPGFAAPSRRGDCGCSGGRSRCVAGTCFCRCCCC